MDNGDSSQNHTDEPTVIDLSSTVTTTTTTTQQQKLSLSRIPDSPLSPELIPSKPAATIPSSKLLPPRSPLPKQQQQTSLLQKPKNYSIDQTMTRYFTPTKSTTITTVDSKHSSSSKGGGTESKIQTNTAAVDRSRDLFGEDSNDGGDDDDLDLADAVHASATPVFSTKLNRREGEAERKAAINAEKERKKAQSKAKAAERRREKNREKNAAKEKENEENSDDGDGENGKKKKKKTKKRKRKLNKYAGDEAEEDNDSDIEDNGDGEEPAVADEATEDGSLKKVHNNKKKRDAGKDENEEEDNTNKRKRLKKAEEEEEAETEEEEDEPKKEKKEKKKKRVEVEVVDDDDDDDNAENETEEEKDRKAEAKLAKERMASFENQRPELEARIASLDAQLNELTNEKTKAVSDLEHVIKITDTDDTSAALYADGDRADEAEDKVGKFKPLNFDSFFRDLDMKTKDPSRLFRKNSKVLMEGAQDEVDYRTATRGIIECAVKGARTSKYARQFPTDGGGWKVKTYADLRYTFTSSDKIYKVHAIFQPFKKDTSSIVTVTEPTKDTQTFLFDFSDDYQTLEERVIYRFESLFEHKNNGGVDAELQLALLYLFLHGCPMMK